jgi:hypothetical protein
VLGAAWPVPEGADSLYVGAVFVLGAACLLAHFTWASVLDAAVAADRSGLYLNGRLEIARAGVRTASLQRRGERTAVRLVGLWRPVEVLLEDAHEAERLIAAMGLSRQTSVARYWMRWGRRRETAFGAVIQLAGTVVAPVAIVVVGRFLRLPAWTILGTVGISMGCGWAFWLRQGVSVAVGPDGVFLRRWIGRARFIQLDDIDSAKRENADVLLCLRDGGQIYLSHVFTKRVSARHWQGDVAGELVARVTERLAPPVRACAVGSVVARGGRATGQWIDDVGALSTKCRSFRQAVVPAEVLWHIVEDASAGETARAGAAMALRAELDIEGHARVRAAADACAAPRLRAALAVIGSDVGDAGVAAVVSCLDDSRRT